jgi:transposase-like protein
MKKEVRLQKCQKIIEAGIVNLFNSQDVMDVDKFALSTIETLMLIEREEYLKNIKKGEDIGNGTYARSFKSLSKSNLTINIPRTRNGDFKPITIELLTKGQEQVNELALELYKNGLSTRSVSKILKNFFNEDISFTKVSELAEEFNKVRKVWESKKLDSYYKVIYADALFQSLRREDSYSKEALHIIIGVKEDNSKEVLYLGINPTESSNSWEEAFENIKIRGVQNVDLIVADGLTGMEDVVHKLFPNTDFQKCVIHKMRNVMLKIRPKEKEELGADIKEVFNNFSENSTQEKAIIKLDNFLNKWKIKYPNIKRFFANDVKEFYFTYVRYPLAVRRSIYTTNPIENLNRQIRKATKNKYSFEKESRLLDYVFIVVKDFEIQNWQKYPVNLFANWQKEE